MSHLEHRLEWLERELGSPEEKLSLADRLRWAKEAARRRRIAGLPRAELPGDLDGPMAAWLRRAIARAQEKRARLEQAELGSWL
jgi:hypothetical protein